MIEELVAKVFCTRDCAHLSHWKTRCFSEHMALGSFYEDVIESIDKFVEAHQGAYGKQIDEVKLSNKMSDVLSCLRSDAEWISKNRETLCDGIPALENILDDLVGIYLSTIYKMEFLK